MESFYSINLKIKIKAPQPRLLHSRSTESFLFPEDFFNQTPQGWVCRKSLEGISLLFTLVLISGPVQESGEIHPVPTKKVVSTKKHLFTQFWSIFWSI
ncbi:hypothetical protein LptCag_1299 [Leptospirillum ferriphilum]|uniref:Uncharacterized protein n=1 Tax=Leptospirillum ferriphilum TaxID=178606 RepID=A0A094WB77_9BACT|nr:hypothetical protein ABH19_08215 [Leptospirillum sp. Group II 'CF-1']KGA92922.1 hypothetical protein LptCag_1299 [Leptospirillum ferriphilum]